MYVIIEDGLPDIVVETYDEMNAEIFKGDRTAYQYQKVQNNWYVTFKFFVADDVLVFNTPGVWTCTKEYETYRFPNICSECESSKYMIANVCSLCTDETCVDCGQEDCRCQYTDY